MANQKHLTLDDRIIIETNLSDHKSFKEIGRKLGKDCTTISKEIRNHVIYEHRGAIGRPFNDCRFRQSCVERDLCIECNNKRNVGCRNCNLCRQVCPKYEKEICPKLERPPYVCNGCKDRGHCTLEKRLYRASKAQVEYKSVLQETRSGINITESELKRIDGIISPLLLNGHSVHNICIDHSDSIMYSEKTIYAYVNAGFLTARNIDMPRKIRFRPRKGKGRKFKVDKKCRIDRTYDDFIKYHEAHPELPVTELDSVEGKKGGAVLLTIHIVPAKLQLAYLRDANDSASVTTIFRNIYRTLGDWDYKQIFPLLLADNGSEFSDPNALEFNDTGERISRLYYCNASSPGQKGHCENNHEFIRRIIPKGTDLGIYTQAQITLAMNHINSYGRPELNNKSPYEMFSFLYGENLLRKLGVIQIPRNEIILRPKLLNTSKQQGI